MRFVSFDTPVLYALVPLAPPAAAVVIGVLLAMSSRRAAVGWTVAVLLGGLGL
ncbi:MAG: hypothetical protein GY939_06135 [Actinomycetia bacterium]|nr:hypothetical protein [Actinomycetes bacterium]